MGENPQRGRVRMPAAITLFRNEPDHRKLEEGDYIFRAGETGVHMYGIIDGAVDVIVGDVAVEQVGPGGIVGEMAVLEDEPRTASARASEAVTITEIDQERFLELIKVNPYFAIEVMRVLSDRLRQQNVRGIE
jgi:CRP-like cAMP-binding protein